MSEGETPCDVALVGGGLANSLIALELGRRRPELRVVVLEARVGDLEPHTWCLFESDMPQGAGETVLPWLDHVWGAYSVSFPGYTRDLTTRYGCLTSERLQQLVATRSGATVARGRAVHVASDHVVTEDGATFRAPLVIDGRGARPSATLMVAFQKFAGLEVRLKRPHGLAAPVMMDATVRQEDGYRFIYLLPLDPSRVLIEDTRYSDKGALEPGRLGPGIDRYARSQGWEIAEVVRRESGVLPIAMGGDIEAFWAEAPADVPQVGMRGAFFHPTTGYSFPDALRVAELVAANAQRGSAEVAARLRARSLRLWRRRGFYRMLNRMLFQAADPGARYRVLERFYRLPQPLIERFYAGRSTASDKFQILTGRPPVPIWRALQAVPERRLVNAHA